MIYEYKKHWLRSGDPMDAINKLAREGWRVISAIGIYHDRQGTDMAFILERPVDTGLKPGVSYRI